MRHLFRILPLLVCLPVFGAGVERVTLTIIVTNPPVTSNTLVVNGNTRTWTNASAATTIATNLTGAGPSATNLYNQIASYPYTGPLLLRWTDTNAIQLIGTLGGSIAASVSGTWATLTLSTQSGPQTYTALWPIEHMVGPTNRTNEASALIQGMSTFSTQALAASSTAVSNLVNLYSNQIVAGNKTFTGTNTFTNSAFNGGSINNSLITTTNAVISNAVIHSLTMTNGANYGNAFRSPGSGGNSEQFGTNSVATNLNSLAIGANAISWGSSASAVGSGAWALQGGDLAFGSGAVANGGNAIAIGVGSEINNTNSIGIGRDVSINHDNSVVIGSFGSSTTSNQITLGSSSQTVTVPGVFAPAGTLTNLTIRGTNVVNARLDFTSRANTGLANGNNSGVILGTNVYIRLSGATTIAALAGFAAEQDGSWHIVQISGSVTNTILNDSGVDATAANRIITGTGADVSFTNSPTVLYLHYDTTASRWRLRLDR